ncbi:hypothetical protein ACG0Z6_14200 [Roseateles sp. BYS180W]|uniref:Pyridine nucleotide-disulphide oxidoreductase dimerisation domain-containing protein n=1 Tax=Roseateles rivi TaxID=3299028 RepID=A0ABW7FYI9_9BURK
MPSTQASASGSVAGAAPASVAAVERRDLRVSIHAMVSLALAIEMGADAVDISKTIHPHPTLGESIGLASMPRCSG